MKRLTLGVRIDSALAIQLAAGAESGCRSALDMSAVFRHPDHAPIEISQAGSLAASAAAVIHWLQVPGNAERVEGWILDLRFAGRDPDSTATTKEVLPFVLIERLAALRILMRSSIDPQGE